MLVSASYIVTADQSCTNYAAVNLASDCVKHFELHYSLSLCWPYGFSDCRYEDEQHPGVCQAMEQAARSFMFDCDGNSLEVESAQQPQCSVEEIEA